MTYVKRQYVDEDKVSKLCDEIENQFRGKGYKRPLSEVFAEIQSFGPFANEFIEDLKRLEKKFSGRINDLNAFVADVLGRTHRIRIRATAWNLATKSIEEREKKFRIEITEPLFWEHSPFTFSARVYVDEKFVSHISCSVSDADLANIPLTNKSLSKREARLRRLGERCEGFRWGFQRFIEDEWKAGRDLAALKNIAWTETGR